LSTNSEQIAILFTLLLNMSYNSTHHPTIMS
jgi:hypothetical protein